MRTDVSPWSDEEISTLIRLWPTHSAMSRTARKFRLSLIASARLRNYNSS